MLPINHDRLKLTRLGGLASTMAKDVFHQQVRNALIKDGWVRFV
ncbi:XisH family protein [Planktothrix agardhii]|uniref:Uncharacterized protein n=1 Tax=Planktothrix agardhii (strain NIVA-CYA 126/8) TaxID=388467 RepID=A0A073CXG2_PLAA1|nr:XisH family protein [Planktothrix agardhii]KEI68715.1 hypothetical protein A19Y_3999 [Planktothrix agardhii NIVA-CYA 126/8]MCF3581866.1 XisH family protein [Planktothrix agardhii 1811]MCF3622256.1 XisH family protein [Planktothrix agardhii 1030]MCF3626562.1 XisH family protein [Planktothrix agardhii 1801]MCF3643966.1 XisH family protein [Planktothrix agardhii 1026]